MVKFHRSMRNVFLSFYLMLILNQIFALGFSFAPLSFPAGKVGVLPAHQMFRSGKSNFFLRPHTTTTTSTTLASPHKSKKNSNDDDNWKSMSRFTSPKIDDRGLPFADALIAQIVGPTLQVFWLAVNHAPSPTWLKLAGTFPARGSLVAPTLIHGAGLACCWLGGALAAKAFESEAFDTRLNNGSYSEVFSRIFKAGAFAVGILIFSTQIDLFLEFGGRYVSPGESEETDIRLLSAFVEILNDVFFEGLVLSSWRFYLASQSSKENIK